MTGGKQRRHLFVGKADRRHGEQPQGLRGREFRAMVVLFSRQEMPVAGPGRPPRSGPPLSADEPSTASLAYAACSTASAAASSQQNGSCEHAASRAALEVCCLSAPSVLPLRCL